MNDSLYAVILNYKRWQIISHHKTEKEAHIARVLFAKRHIKNFIQIWQNYLKTWQNYHMIEYPQYPVPKDRIILEQLLAEDCHLLVEPIDLDDLLDKSINYQKKSLDKDFYQNLEVASHQFDNNNIN